MAPSEGPGAEAAHPAGHDATADRFGQVVDAVTDWDAPTPVPEWRARDVVHHLTTWLPDLLGSCGVDLPTGELADPVGSWHRQDEALRALLATRGDEVLTHPFLGTKTLAEMLAQVYVGDVFLHTWDLARASGQEGRARLAWGLGLEQWLVLGWEDEIIGLQKMLGADARPPQGGSA